MGNSDSTVHYECRKFFSNRSSIYKNLYISLLSIEILFLIGIELTETHVLCGFMSAFIHCSFLCAIAWIFFEAFQLYIMVTTDDMLLDVEKSSKIIWYYLLTYGLSFTIVAIALGIDPSTYTKADRCVWMETNNLFYFTFVTPIVFFILANLVYSTMTFYGMCKKHKTSLKNKEHTRLSSVRFYLRCSIIFLFLFVSVWLSGFLYMKSLHVNHEETIQIVREVADNGHISASHQSSSLKNGYGNVYGYIFVVLNAFQGVYVFIFHCILNEKFRREYTLYIRQIKWIPRCLRCSKTEINGGGGGISAVGSNGSGVADGGIGTCSGVNTSPSSHYHPSNGGGVGNDTSGSCAINANESQKNDRAHNHNITTDTGTIASVRHHHIPYYRTNYSSAGNISPSTSSIGSSQLIYNGHDWNYLQKPQTEQISSTSTMQSRKLKRSKMFTGDSNAGGIDSTTLGKESLCHDNVYDDREHFYWTDNSNHRRKQIQQNQFQPYIGHTDDLMLGIEEGVGAATLLASKNHILNFSNCSNSNSLMKVSHHNLIDQMPVPSTKSSSGVSSSNKKKSSYNQPILILSGDKSGGGGDNLNSSNKCNSNSRYHKSKELHHLFDDDLDNIDSINSTNNRKFHNPENSNLNGFLRSGNGYLEEPVYEEIMNNRIPTDNLLPSIHHHYHIGGVDVGQSLHHFNNLTTGNDHHFRHPGIDNDEDCDEGEDDDDDDIDVINHMVPRNEDGELIDATISNAGYNNKKQTILPLSQQYHDQQKSQGQQMVSRNLSAMLDENNTVVCYLEPLPLLKK